MAGSSSNWYKLQTGPLKGRRVFISNATIAASANTTKASLRAKVSGVAKQIALDSKLSKLAKQSPQPKGLALSKASGPTLSAKAVAPPPLSNGPAIGPENHVTSAPQNKPFVKFNLTKGGVPFPITIPGTIQGGLVVHKVSDLTTVAQTVDGKLPVKTGPKTAYKTGYQVTHLASGQKMWSTALRADAIKAMQALNTSGVDWSHDHPSKQEVATGKQALIDFVKQGV